MNPSPPETVAAARRTRGQIWLITLGAIGLVVILNQFAGRRDLSPTDFVVGGFDALEFCDPNHPRFLPATTAAPRPATLEVAWPSASGGAAELTLRTASGQPIRREDLAITEGRTLRVFVVDRALDQIAEASPFESRPGQWLFSFHPTAGRAYRAFADFTPTATGREMYATADLGEPGAADRSSAADARNELARAETDGYRFTIDTAPIRLFARQPLAVNVRISRADGGPVLLQPIAGVWADLLVFDERLSALAKFPLRSSEGAPPDPRNPTLTFAFRLSDPGRFVFWVELHLGDQTVFRRFTAEVLP
jgi:hypothetical protein